MAEETYLGDGVYVSHDGYQFIVRTERETGRHWIALEDEVMAALFGYASRFYAVRAETVLSEADSAKFVEALENPPEPNEALKAAAERYKTQLEIDDEKLRGQSDG
jgi:Protein of unknown function (DUF1778)